jgi:hypothetical protein
MATAVNYRANAGLVDVQHGREEIADLQELSERGPYRDTIERIEVRRVDHNASGTLTAEQVEQP